MLKVLENRSAISQTQRQLVRQARARAGRGRRAPIGFPGGTTPTTNINDVWWFDDLEMFLAYQSLANRYENALGTVNPFAARAPAPVVEVNPPFTGISRKIQGVFLKDESGRTYLAHRGRLGGGTKGIGSNFFEWYPAEMRRTVLDGDREAEVILIARLGAPRFWETVRDFVLLAQDFKEGKSPTKATADRVKKKYYYDEFQGTTMYNVSEAERAADFVHGRVVKALKLVLEKKGHALGKDPRRDLFIQNDAGQPMVLFEVKTLNGSQSLYTAVGQLFWNQVKTEHLVAVVPKGLDAVAKGRLTDLGVGVVLWDEPQEGRFVFDGLDELLP